MQIRTSPLVAAAETAQRPTKWWVGYLFALIVPAFVVGGLVGYLGYELTGVEPGTESLPQQLIEGAIWLATAATIIAWVVLREKRPWRTVGLTGSGGLRRFGLGMVIGVGLMVLVTGVSIALGQHELVDQPDGVTGGAAVVPALLLVVVWIVQGSTEEIVNRGYLLQIGGIQLPAWPAVLLPAVAFTVVHLSNEGADYPLVVVNLLVFALFATFVALAEGSLWLVCGIHAAWNWAQGNLLGLPVSGNSKEVALVKFQETSEATTVLSGGPFGPEGGLVSTVVWGIAAIAAYRWYRQQEASRTPDPVAT